MRLFLSSQDFGIYPEVLLDLVGNKRRVVFINNAKDNLSKHERAEHSLEKQESFERIGFNFTEIDLREYFGKKAELLNKLSNIDLVWAAGGNTFILRRALAESGLDEILKDKIKNDDLVYGGSSAGAIVATPSLHGTEYGDEPTEVPDGYKKEILWDGLNLVPFYIIPHYKSDWFGKQSEEMLAYLQKKELPYYTLMDGQVIVVDGKKEEHLK